MTEQHRASPYIRPEPSRTYPPAVAQKRLIDSIETLCDDLDQAITKNPTDEHRIRNLTRVLATAYFDIEPDARGDLTHRVRHSLVRAKDVLPP